MKKKFRIASMLLTVVLLMSAFLTPVAAGQGNGRGQEKQSEQQIQYIDAEVQVINGQPVIKVETEEGDASYKFPWPEVAVVDGKKVGLERQGNYFLLPTDDGIEKVSIEEFQVALVAGQLMLLTSVNPWWTIPVAVATVALKAAGVAITTATLKAATILIAAGKMVTARTVHVVVSSWPRIEAALIGAGRAVGGGGCGRRKFFMGTR
ncbi:MAG: hypothetical protein M1552_09650 [Firmicutes bacterium]|jgi:hypothetical protein|nr:hypothetical protein [Bacillota bacterium]MCL5994394.1 hypothetical protein [Bacillota bacterium]